VPAPITVRFHPITRMSDKTVTPEHAGALCAEVDASAHADVSPIDT
jgi:hypothetical protein